MTIRLMILEDPLDSKKWEQHEVPDLMEFLVKRFGKWPATARIYDMEGFEVLDRVATTMMTTLLASRDVTPPGDPGPAHDRALARLESLPGPFVIAVAPADPITAIIAVVAVAVGIAAALFLMPKIPEINSQYQSPNNSLSDRQNRARPDGRIPDIFGTVRSIPDLLAVPYKCFKDNLEYEIAYMCVGRGAYDIADVRDGDTVLTAIAGAGASFYAPGTSPNGGTPSFSLGTPVTEPVYSVVKLNEVNGQILRPPNSNNVKGDEDIRFVYPDQIQTTGDSDFTEFFETDDQLTISGAAFTGTSGTTSTTQDARFNYSGVIDFQSYNPTALFSAGDYLTIANGVYVGEDGLGGTIYGDVSGTYLIDAVDSNSITLSDPADVNSDWDQLDSLPSDRTEYRSSVFSTVVATSGLNLDGTYAVLAVTSSTITLSNPALVNSAWNNLDDLPGGATDYISPALSTSGVRWVGPFTIALDGMTKALLNFTALQGLYFLTKKGRDHPVQVSIEVELTPVDADDDPIGPSELFPATMGLFDVIGDDPEISPPGTKDAIYYSVWAEPTFTGRCRVRVRRTSPTDLDEDHTVVDEVKWRDTYGLAEVEQADFGNVTTVQTRTYATSSATSVKDRKLNLRARRRLPERVSGSTFTGLIGTDRVDDIVSAISLDPYIGDRPPEQIDFDNIYSTVAEVEDYFGSERAVEFGYTFDDDNLSFEETIATIAQCCFCSAYRQGSLMRISFERATDASVLLFNHRNTMPMTQHRSVTLGVNDDHDGVELNWTAARDGAALTYDIPFDRSAVSPRKVEVVGIRSGELAYWHAQRAWNKLKFQSITLEQECTQEAALVIPTDRVLITDQTRPPGYEGEVLGVDGLDLLLSQPTDFADGVAHTIFLQHIDATVEALSVGPWTPPPGWDLTTDEYPANYRVTLATAPRADLAVGDALSARPMYEIVPATDKRSRAYLVTTREPQSDFTETLQAINYSPMYYINDEAVTWIAFQEQTFRDQSPWMRDGVLSGPGSIVTDDARGKFVYSASGTGASVAFSAFTPPASYSKAAWIKATSGSILSSSAEVFSIVSGNLVAHNGSAGVSVPAPSSSGWHHALVTYNGPSSTMELYVDGVLVDEATSIARGTLAQLSAFADLVGRVDDLRLWKRALSAPEVLSLYRSTQRPTV